MAASIVNNNGEWISRVKRIMGVVVHLRFRSNTQTAKMIKSSAFEGNAATTSF